MDLIIGGLAQGKLPYAREHFGITDGEVAFPLSEAYRHALSRLERFLAACCDCVVEICSGQAVIHQGRLKEE